MSPEQAMGEKDVDHRTDLYGLGCILYEMLTGERPFAGLSPQAVLSKKVLGEVPSVTEARPEASAALGEIIATAMATKPANRYASATEMQQAFRAAMEPEGGLTAKERARRRVVIGAVAVVGIAALTVMGVALQNSRFATRVAQQIAEMERLVNTGDFTQALVVGKELMAAVPDDSTLTGLWPRFSFAFPLRSDPSGAAVHMRRLGAEDSEWEILGETPIESVRLAEGELYRLRFALDGYETREFLHQPFRNEPFQAYPSLDPVKLDGPGEIPEGMVRVPAFPTTYGDSTIDHGEYLVDRYEVTNRDFKDFVDAGGYGSPEYWSEPLEAEGSELTWEDAMSRFKDESGRPGPSTWSLGTYPDGQEDYPVGGISWYEAAAYAVFKDKELPTTIHWMQAIRYWRAASWAMAAGSNLGGDGPRPVGLAGAMGPFGIYDQVGNVREWGSNVVGWGRATRGGGWNDPPFMATHILPKDPWDRDPTHGVRLAKTFDAEEVAELARGPIDATRRRDYRNETPVSKAEYEIFARLYEYDPVALTPTVEAIDTFPHWVRETVTFELPYGERGGAYLYLPVDASRPMGTILYWAGSGVLAATSVDQEYLQAFEFLARSGWAVAQPVWHGSFWRDPSNEVTHGTYLRISDRPAYRDAQIRWYQDMAVTLDYLETRSEFDSRAVGFFGHSWGGQAAPLVLALDDRLKAAVLSVGGLWPNFQFIPEADPLHFAPHVTQPVLMINGEFDNVFPLETAQEPLFRLLGTDPADKRHHVTERAHRVDREVLFRETLDWFDKYLGPVGR
jgi:dienelactone hydrolase